MNFLYLIFALVALFIIWNILFAIKGGNFYLISRNIARVYKTIKNRCKDKYQNETELLFIAGVINAKMYILKDKGLISKIYLAAKSCSRLSDEIDKVSNFAQILMHEYFLQDSKKSSSEILTHINIMKNTINKSISRELESKKYFPENVIKKDIPIIKEYYYEHKE